MTPADDGEFSFNAGGAMLPVTQAILLYGGRTLLLMEGCDTPPPDAGALIQPGGEALTWTSECWPIEAEGAPRWCGIAVVDALPTAGAELRSPSQPACWRFGALPRIDVAPHPLAEFVRKAGVDRHAVFAFLVRRLIDGCPADTTEAQAHRAFARGFFTAAAERDGFIEIIATPEGGGVFAQGWSLSLQAGPATLASVAGDLVVHEVDVALFDRDDILPPGHGFCMFDKAWRGGFAANVDAVFFEKDGRLLRLDVVTGALARFEGAGATGHVAGMLPRLCGPAATLGSFRRICRPRFTGEDTLSGTRAPISAGFDSVMQAPDGGLLAKGWLLDPLRRVRLAILKGDTRFYAQIQTTWIRLPRPDLCDGFGADPRFAGLLDPEDALYGFIVHAPANAHPVEDAQFYLELVLEDDSCLFRPLAVTPFASGERLPQVLAALSPTEPELGRIIEEHLTPFLASVPPRSRAPSSSRGARPIPLGGAGPARDVSAIMPARSMAELQPVLGLLAGAPESAALDLVLVASRAHAAEMLKALGEAFRFYGLRGALVIASDRDTTAARLDAGVEATTGARVLAWTPSVLPKTPGWLARLVAELDDLPAPGLISPLLTYEDGSICYGGAGAAEPGPICAVAGYGADWLDLGAPRPLAAGAADIALVDRETLAHAGGFAGRLFSDAYARIDLADRLRRTGADTWCSGAVQFWMLEDPHLAEPDPFARVLEQLDAGLLRNRASEIRGDRLR